MTTEIQTWFKNMREAWVNKRPEDMADLLSDNFKYYESPIEKPLVTKQSVVDAWQEIKSQNIEYVKINIIHETDSVGVALWQFKEIGQAEHVGSYFLELNPAGKCVNFRQWWHVKD